MSSLQLLQDSLGAKGMGGPLERLSAIVGLRLKQGLDTFNRCSLYWVELNTEKKMIFMKLSTN